jgi:hypothetical protein
MRGLRKESNKNKIESKKMNEKETKWKKMRTCEKSACKHTLTVCYWIN